MPTLDRTAGIVLDTHAWIWSAVGDRRARALEGHRGRCHLPAICVWEAAMLAAKKRIAFAPSVAEWVAANLRPPVFFEPLSPAISLRSAALEEFHGDPADRMIVATAIELRLPLVTADSRILRWGEGREGLVCVEIG